MKTDISDRADLDKLIETFYGRVFADGQVGPFFTQVARVTPETHFSLLADFWETVLFGKNLYHHNVIQKHVELHRQRPLEPHHFERWVSIFYETVDELFAGPVAEQAKTRAQSMAMVLQVKVHILSTTKP
ncbi:MAG: group III truncated hemoglobin [Bacteroidetes bacterium]|nr:group III truncated hemoglobin [Fibrella sp.]